MAVGLILMIAAIGSAIDLGRLYITQSQMQAGVDAAALAAASAFDNTSTTDPAGRRQQAISYIRDNFPDAYMGVGTVPGQTPVSPTVTLLEPQFSSANGISHTVVNATGNLPMTFMAMFGVGPRTIAVTASADFQPHPLEVMAVLDNTGSMNDQIDGIKKINALKTAMHSFINVLYQGTSGQQPQLALGIINYTNLVNVGPILRQYNIPVEEIPGFTDQWPSWDSGNPMAWKGCVANDETTPNMSSSLAVREVNAYDIWNAPPGEFPQPGAPHAMAPIKPFLYPPLWESANTGASIASPASGFYTPSGNGTNLYPAPAWVPSIAASATFKRYFYKYYIGLNNGAAQAADDVIVASDGSSYYDPTAPGAFNPITNTGTDFVVRPNKIPNLAYYRAPTQYQIADGTAPVPTPNFQCPEPGLPIRYGIDRSVYDNFIDNKVWGIQPGYGTVHHAGLLWGWRLLSRYSVFTRTRPAGTAAPERAIVFMTDGKTDVNSNDTQHWLNTYGGIPDRQITTVASREALMAASDLRFAKTCAIANSTTFADSGKRPKIFVVAINNGSDIDSASVARLSACGAAGFWLTTNPTDLNAAFMQIGRTLVDVHLTK